MQARPHLLVRRVGWGGEAPHRRGGHRGRVHPAEPGQTPRLLLLALEPERRRAHRGAHVRLHADEGGGRTDEQLDGSGRRAPQARGDLRRRDEGPHDVRHPLPHGVAGLPLRDAGCRAHGFHLRRAEHADHVEDRNGRARPPRRLERLQPRTPFRRRLRSRAPIRDALPAGQHHLVGRIGLRRQRAARQEVPRAPHRELPREARGLARGAHDAARGREPRRRDALHRRRVPERVRQDEPRHARAAARVRGLEAPDDRRRHRVDACRRRRASVRRQP